MNNQQPGGGARHHPAMPTWSHIGDTNSLHTVYYQHLSGYNQGQPGRLSRGTFVRRSGRRIRTSYTDDQLTKLEEVFSKQRYMTGTEKMLLASVLRLTQTQVKVWFQNRRTRWRKAHGDIAGVPESHAHGETPSKETDELISVDNDESWVYF
ncbi:homeobox protein notochord-like [Oncorhynchus tshawytscha]|uniref:homeobox protein notochord-like n=1 Tax=Oncorhynchus tshawytscha TaxID=74940 RepID=UPI000D0A2DEF|nr:homeobox protein notochord-like [Oncorhynchus tshawytscha]